MSAITKKVAIYCCDDSNPCSSTVFDAKSELLEEWALGNERASLFTFERYADSEPATGTPYTEWEASRYGLMVLVDDIEKGQISILVTDDINPLAKSPRALLKLIKACVKRKVPIRVLGPERCRKA